MPTKFVITIDKYFEVEIWQTLMFTLLFKWINGIFRLHNFSVGESEMGIWGDIQCFVSAFKWIKEEDFCYEAKITRNWLLILLILLHLNLIRPSFCLSGKGRKQSWFLQWKSRESNLISSSSLEWTDDDDTLSSYKNWTSKRTSFQLQSDAVVGIPLNFLRNTP